MAAPKIAGTRNASPANIAFTIQSIGEMNMNVNSIGSVIPVQNDCSYTGYEEFEDSVPLFR